MHAHAIHSLGGQVKSTTAKWLGKCNLSTKTTNNHKNNAKNEKSQVYRPFIKVKNKRSKSKSETVAGARMHASQPKRICKGSYTFRFSRS